MLTWPSPHPLERGVRAPLFPAGHSIPAVEMGSQKAGIGLPVINDQEEIRGKDLLQIQQIYDHLSVPRQLRAIQIDEIRRDPGHLLVAPALDAVRLDLDQRSVDHLTYTVQVL